MDTAIQKLISAFEDGWEPFDRRALVEWVRDNITFPNAYAIPGPVHLSLSRYLLFPAECWDNDLIRMINLLAPVQTGKSMLSELALQWVIENSPGPTMFNVQNDDEAKEHWKTRILPTGKLCEVNREYFKRANLTKGLVQFPHMDLYMQGANLSNFQRKSIKYQFNSETWLWKKKLMENCFGRSEAFEHNCKIINESQGGDAGADWDNTWNDGKRYHYGIECGSCGKSHRLEIFDYLRSDSDRKKRAGLIWDPIRDNHEMWKVWEAAETVRYKCPHCGTEYGDTPKNWDLFNESGRYICVDPERPVTNTSIRWSALVKRGWKGLVVKWLKASNQAAIGNYDPKKNFFQKFDAKNFTQKMVEKLVVLKKSDYAMGESFTWEVNRFMIVDVQDGRGGDDKHFWVLISCWGENGRSARVFYGRIERWEDIRTKQLEFGVKNPCVAVDCAHRLYEVAGECAKYNWSMLNGDDRDTFTHYELDGKNKLRYERPFSPWDNVDPFKGKEGQGRFFAYRMFWSNLAIKNQLWNLVNGKGLKWETAKDIPDQFEEQLFSEAKKIFINPNNGKRVDRWVPLKPNNPNNHSWDCCAMDLVCAIEAGLVPYVIDVIDDKPPPVPGEVAVAPHDKPKQMTFIANE